MLLDEIAARLTSEGLVSSGFTVYKGWLPATPDKVIALNEFGGSGPETFMDGPSIEQPSLQIVVRGAARDDGTPRLQIQRIYQAIVDWGGFTASGVHYLGLTALQAPFPVLRDNNDRVVFSVNFLVKKEMSPLV